MKTADERGQQIRRALTHAPARWRSTRAGRAFEGWVVEVTLVAGRRSVRARADRASGIAPGVEVGHGGVVRFGVGVGAGICIAVDDRRVEMRGAGRRFDLTRGLRRGAGGGAELVV